MEQCKCCERTNQDLRFGICFDCADAENVIAGGTNMFDEEIPLMEGYSIHLSKVKYILTKFNVANKK
jgi:hypothetical protein